MKKNEVKAWELFSQTGAVGAYLTYRAMRIRQGREENPNEPLD